MVLYFRMNIGLRNGHQIIYVNQERVWQGICKLKWITFDQFFESLKVCFIVFFLEAKNCKVKNL